MPDVTDMALQASLAGQQSDMLPRNTSQTSVTTAGPTSTASQSTTTPVLPPDYQQAVADLDAASARGVGIANQQAALQTKLGQVAAEEAKVNQWKAQQDELAAQQAQAETDRIKREMAPVINGARAWSAQQQQKYASMKPGDYWQEKGFGARVVAAIAAGLGALGAGLARTDNYAQKILSEEVDAYNAKERQKIEQQGKIVEMAQQGNVQAQQMLATQMADQHAREAARYSFIARQQASMLAKAGANKAQIQNDVIVQQNLAKANQAEQESINRKIQALGRGIGSQTTGSSRTSGHTSTTNTKGTVEVANPNAGASKEFQSKATGKGATDAERKADGFADRMATQLNIMRNLQPLSEEGRQTIRSYLSQEKWLETHPGVDAAAKMAGLRESLGQKLTDNDRAYWNALSEFASANLRQESGAAISVSEKQDAFERYAPVLGDKPGDIQRKLKAAEGAAMVTAKQSYRPDYWAPILAGKPQATQPPAWKPGARVRNPQTGQTGVVGDDGSVIPDGQ